MDRCWEGRFGFSWSSRACFCRIAFYIFMIHTSFFHSIYHICDMQCYVLKNENQEIVLQN